MDDQDSLKHFKKRLWHVEQKIRDVCEKPIRRARAKDDLVEALDLVRESRGRPFDCDHLIGKALKLCQVVHDSNCLPRKRNSWLHTAIIELDRPSPELVELVVPHQPQSTGKIWRASIFRDRANRIRAAIVALLFLLAALGWKPFENTNPLAVIIAVLRSEPSTETQADLTSPDPPRHAQLLRPRAN